MCPLYIINDCIELFSLSHIYCIVVILSNYRLVSRNNYNIHSIYITKFLFLSLCSTCHTCLFLKLIKEVLEGYSSKCLRLSPNIDMFLSFDSLMKSITISSAWHYTSGKFIYYKNLAVLNYIVLISVHKIICSKCKYNTMLYLKIFRIC